MPLRKPKQRSNRELAGLKLKTLLLPFAHNDLSLKHYLAAIEPPITLWLAGTKVTDEGLKELSGLKSLLVLGLNDRLVTYAGLKELVGLKSLRRLSLSGTKVTAAGLNELQKALPACMMSR